MKSLRIISIVVLLATSCWSQGGQYTQIRNGPANPAVCTAAGGIFGKTASGLQYCNLTNTWSHVTLSPSSFTTGHCTKFTAAGDLTDTGSPCGTVAYLDIAQNAAASGTLYAVPVGGTGNYRVCYNANLLTIGSVSSVLGGATGFRVIYTNADNSVSVTTSQGNLAGFAVSAANTTQAQVSGCIIVNAKASTNITYTFGYTSNAVGEMLFGLHATVEAL